MEMFLQRFRASMLLTTIVVGGTLLLVGCAPAAQVAPTSSPPVLTPTATIAATGETPSPTTALTVTSSATVTPAAAMPTVAGMETPVIKQPGCQNLESILYNLTRAGDPAAYAAQHRLYFTDGKVRVVIEMKSASENFPSGYNVGVESREGELVQALVATSDLCPLSNEPQVRYVRTPTVFSR